jgi:hypothetical protein
MFSQTAMCHNSGSYRQLEAELHEPSGVLKLFNGRIGKIGWRMPTTSGIRLSKKGVSFVSLIKDCACVFYLANG